MTTEERLARLEAAIFGVEDARKAGRVQHIDGAQYLAPELPREAPSAPTPDGDAAPVT